MFVGNVLATPSVGADDDDPREATVDDLDLSGESRSRWPSGGMASGTRTASGSPGSGHTGSRTSTSWTTSSRRTAGTSGWHSHPGPSIVFVVAGTVTNYSSDDPSCSPHVYTAGQSFVDPGGDDEHMLRNEDPTVVAETIAVQFIPAGATRRIDEPAPVGCPS